MMRTLNVYIEINGSSVPVGSITGNNGIDAVFTYDKNFLKRNIPISVSLPLQEESFDAERTKAFFEGLLPEGFTRKSVARWMHLDEDDYLSILAGLGRECIGAIRIEDAAEQKTDSCSYRKLSVKEVRQLAEEGATRSSEIVVTSHISLTGASGKVGLYYNPENNCWYQPMGTAPSTHIVKQSHVRLANIVENEQLVLLTASNLGIPTAESFIISTGNTDNGSILLATRRYDRDMQHSYKNINGMPIPLRLHQEDFAQALGIPSSQKYEEEGSNYLTKIFRLIRNVSANPIQDQIKLLDILIFDVFIGNTDNHIKNFSLLYGSDLKTIRLAPAYDLVSTLLYKEGTSEMSIAINGEKEWRNIKKETFAAASDEIGMRKQVIEREYDRIAGEAPSALKKAALELTSQGFKEARKLYENINKIMQKKL